MSGNQVKSCGVIIFYNDQIVIVKSRKNKYSFPKGKQKKGEDNYSTALRELYEESSLLESDLEFLYHNNEYITFIEEKPRKKVFYYLAILKNKKKLDPIDKDEILEALYIDVEKGIHLSSFNPQRKELLKQSYELVSQKFKEKLEKYS